MLTGSQIRAARGLLGWSQKELATRAEVGFTTVQRAERESDVVKGNVQTVLKILSTLQSAGVEFIDANQGKGPGVRLAQPIRERP